MNSASHVHHGTDRRRRSSVPSTPVRSPRFAPWRATHSSRPTAGLVSPSAVEASSAPSSGSCRPGREVSSRSSRHTLLMSAFPKSPCGRNSMNMIRIRNTIRSDHVVVR